MICGYAERMSWFFSVSTASTMTTTQEPIVTRAGVELLIENGPNMSAICTTSIYKLASEGKITKVQWEYLVESRCVDEQIYEMRKKRNSLKLNMRFTPKSTIQHGHTHVKISTHSHIQCPNNTQWVRYALCNTIDTKIIAWKTNEQFHPQTWNITLTLWILLMAITIWLTISS